MGKLKDMIMDVMDDFRDGHKPQEISDKYEVPVDFVYQIIEMCEQEELECEE